MAADARANVLIDGYHHGPPAMWLGGRAVMGQFATNLGRYTLEDNYHTNGYFVLNFILADACVLRQGYRVLTAEELAGCDILVIVNPDYEGYPGYRPPFDDREIAAIHDFVARGGSLLMMINSFLPVEGDYLWKENYDIASSNRILAPFGLSGGNHISGDAEYCPVAPDDPIFGDVGTIEYGHGGQIHVSSTPGVEQRVHFGYEGRVYGVSARAAGGTVLAIADAGMISNGLVTFPHVGNLVATQRMFRSLRPAWLGEAWAVSYETIDFHAIGYPHEGKPGAAEFAAVNPRATPEVAYNYHYQYQERRERVARAPLPADPLAVLEGRARAATVDLLSPELFGFTGPIEVPLRVVATRPNADLIEVEAVGSAPLPHQPLAAFCRGGTTAFGGLEIEGGVQSLTWRFRVNTLSGQVIDSVLKMMASPTWFDAAHNPHCITLARTQIVAPWMGE